MRIHRGNLIITAENADQYRDLTEVSGSLYIHANAKLDALQSVGWFLYISADAKLDAPALQSVGGHLEIDADAKLDAPALQSIGGDLYVAAGAKLDAPALQSVGGDLYIYAGAKIDAPALQSVGGDLYIRADANLDAPELYPPGFSKFRVIDGLPCVVLSEKTRDGVTILSCRAAMVKDQKLVGDRFYIAQRGENNAHGKTISEAMQELAFKTAKRDLTQYRAMPLDTSKTPKQWALVYRDITGACKLGAEMFMQGKGKLKRRYTLAEIIEETHGAYRSEIFVEAVK